MNLAGRKNVRIVLTLIPMAMLFWLAAGCATIEGMIDVDAPVLDTVYISPAVVDGKNDQLVLPLDIIPDQDIVIRGYRFTIANTKGVPYYILENSIPAPKPLAGKKERSLSVNYPRELVWIGKDFDGDFVPDGEYIYFIEAWDGLGNEGRSPDYTVIVDNTPPTVELSAPYLLFSPNGDSRRDSVTFKQDKSTIEEIWTGALYDSGDLLVYQWDWENTLPAEVEWDGYGDNGIIAPDGLYTYILSSTDRAGNEFSSVLDGIQVDTRPSPITLNLTDRYLSPNGDGAKDTLTFEPFLEIGDGVVSWKIEVLDGDSLVKSRVEMEGLPPETIEYDGKDTEGMILCSLTHLRMLWRLG